VSKITLSVIKADIGAGGNTPSIPPYYFLKVFADPFDKVSIIKFGLPQTSTVTITISEINNRPLTTMIWAEKDAGYHVELWDGRDPQGIRVPAGFYFCQLSAGDVFI
jgi:hypothetical protein